MIMFFIIIKQMDFKLLRLYPMLISYVQNPQRDKLTIANSTRIHNEEPRDMNLNSLIALISCQQSVIFRVCICYKTMYIYIYISAIYSIEVHINAYLIFTYLATRDDDC